MRRVKPTLSRYGLRLVRPWFWKTCEICGEQVRRESVWRFDKGWLGFAHEGETGYLCTRCAEGDEAEVEKLLEEWLEKCRNVLPPTCGTAAQTPKQERTVTIKIPDFGQFVDFPKFPDFEFEMPDFAKVSTVRVEIKYPDGHTVKVDGKPVE